jgi:hypothetical protein
MDSNICNTCSGEGYLYHSEDDEVSFYSRYFEEPCYTCGSKGVLNEEQFRLQNLNDLARYLTSLILRDMKDAANEGEDGWDFRAAENGLDTYTYEQCLLDDYSDKTYRMLYDMSKEDQDFLLAWNESAKNDPFIRPRVKVEIEEIEPLPYLSEDDIPF